MAIFAALLGLLLAFAQPVHAQDPAKLSDAVSIIKNIIKLLAPAAGIAFFVMLLVGGYQFMTSGGDPKAVGAARNTLTYAVIGIILSRNAHAGVCHSRYAQQPYTRPLHQVLIRPLEALRNPHNRMERPTRCLEDARNQPLA